MSMINRPRIVSRQRLRQGRRRPDFPHVLDLCPRRRRVPGGLSLSRRDAEGTRRDRALRDARGLGATERHVRPGRPGRGQRALPPDELWLRGASGREDV